jgi:hypothetical protein
MGRKENPNSVGVKVSILTRDESIEFDNPLTSVMVMVSNLKKLPEHKEKVFKIKNIKNKTIVTRIK